MQASQTSHSEITLYYDGLCQLCSREIEHYRKMSGADHIIFVDITAANFDAVAEGLDPHKIHQSLHVKDAQGKTYLGVEAFIMVWSQLDSLKKIVPVVSLKPVKKVLEAGYFVFAKVRPLLPRKKCSDSPYCELK